MKKAFLFTTAIFVHHFLSAQSFGLQAGTNLASVTFKTQGVTIGTSDKAGFIAGIVAEIPISDIINFRPELNFVQKGGKLVISGTSENIVTLNYLELPLNIVYNVEVKSGNVFLGGGPSIAFGISGQEKAKDLQAGTEMSASVAFDGQKNANTSDGKSHYKAADIGFNLLGGYKLNSGLFFNIGYTFGLSNITAEDNITAKNKGFYLKVGYFLPKVKSKKSK